MNNKLKETIFRILDIIEYKQDKNILTDRLINECYIETVIQLIGLIPYEKRQLFLSDFGKKSPSELKQYIFSYFTAQQISLSLETSIKHVITEYVRSVAPELSPKQIQKLQSMKV
jgi:hypothetical protein